MKKCHQAKVTPSLKKKKKKKKKQNQAIILIQNFRGQIFKFKGRNKFRTESDIKIEKNYDIKDCMTIDGLLIPLDIDMKTEQDDASDIFSSFTFLSNFDKKLRQKIRQKQIKAIRA